MAVQSVEMERAVVAAGGRSIDIVPPNGYCILGDTVETGEQAVFALIGRCSDRPATPFPDGLLTASVSHAPLFRDGAPVADELDALETFLGSAEGRSLLARSTAPEDLEIIETYREDDMLVLLIEDRGVATLPVSTPRFWRAFLEVNQRMVSVSASALEGDEASDRAVLALLRAFAKELRTANARPVLALPSAG
ncbi:MAG: hypothetical protein AAGD12_12715 [Pseudomonadota bacterium]